MDAETSLEDSAAELRARISHTREDLGHKIESLEDEVRTMAQQVGEAVRKTIDIRERVKERPLLSCMVAAGVGVIVGRRLMRRRSERFMDVEDAPGIPARGITQMLAPEIGALRALLMSKGISMISRLLRVESRPEEAAGAERVH